MKKFVLLASVLLPLCAIAQKDIKPGIPKAEKALQEGKLDEAKSIIDMTTSSQEFMVDKKGGPTKNAARAWYIRGIIYAAIDTSKNEKFKSLEAQPYKVALESWEKSKSLEDSKASVYMTDAMGLPELPTQTLPRFAQQYFNYAVTAFDKEKNYKKAFEYIEKTLYFIPTDTAIILITGSTFAPAAEEHEKSISYIRKYLAAGGKSVEAYTALFRVYYENKKDYDTALKVIQEGIAKNPNDKDLPKFEYDLFVKTNKLPEAKTSLEKQLKADPNDAQGHYFLGLINQELKFPAEAKKELEAAIKIDPGFFDAQVALADVIYADAKEIKREMSQLGISAQDKAKRLELDKVLVEKEKIALPYWEAAEKMQPEDEKVLLTLLSLYQDLDNQAKLKPLVVKMKKLGFVE